MKVKEMFQKKGCYVFVFLVPWLLILIHSLVRDSWLTGEGCILAGDAGNIYYQMYGELWEKVHSGNSLIFTWNAGLGTDFLVNLFGYMMSPFTLLILVFPKSMISNILQFSIVMKWSLAAVTMLYYLLHSKCNELKERKVIVSAVLSLAYCLSNVMLSGLSHVTWLDILVAFPLLLLWEEKMLEGKCYKRFFGILLFCMICSLQAAVPMVLFLFVWYGMLYSMQETKDKRCLARYLYCVAAAAVTSLAIVVPSLMAAEGNGGLSDGREYLSSVKMSIVDLVQRFFVFDSLLVSQASEPMLYCGVVTAAVALMYVFVPVNKKEKITGIVLAVLLCAGFCFGGVDFAWHAGAADIGVGNGYSFLLIFLLVFMALKVLIHLEHIRKWQIVIVMFVCVGAVALGFWKAVVLLDFYVYLGSILLSVLMLLLLFFFCRKSIQYKNILIVFAVLCFGELSANAFLQLEEYNMYPIETCYYHEQSGVLKNSIDLEKGQRVANVQVTPNYGMVMNLPAVSGEFQNVDNGVQALFGKLGMAVTDHMYSYFGGSPLLNMMFNVKYGMAQGEQAYSDVQKRGENNGYILYEMGQQSSLGYMVSDDVLQWDLEQESPFLAQNDYVKRVAGVDDIFEIIMPDIACTSSLGRDPENEGKVHVHSEDEDEHEHDAFHGVYRKEKPIFDYTYSKMYDGDLVKMQFVSDGISDYYVYVDSDAEAYFGLNYEDEEVYADQIESRQKTFHIGVVEKGTQITITANAIADLDAVKDMEILHLSYQVAAFNPENYQKAYDKLSKNLYTVTTMEDTMVKGSITADESGIMMTNIPALDGFTVYVDGSQTECKKIGDALIGVPLEKGKHEITFMYETPGVVPGLIGTCFGILLFGGYCFWVYKQKKG